MSTGDQTQYIRGKIAERGVDQGVRFMKDGFDLWAESTAPARAGEMEKEPAEETNMDGGRMTLHMAKRFQHRRGDEMTGGDIVPEVVRTAIDQARKLIDMWRNVSKWLTDLKTELKYEVVDNEGLPQDIRTVGKSFIAVLSALVGMKLTLDSVAAAASIVGMGRRRHGRMRGGDLASTIKMVTDAAVKIKGIVDWLIRYAPAVKFILNLDSFNTEGGLPEDIGRKVIGFMQPIFGLLGAGLEKVKYSEVYNPMQKTYSSLESKQLKNNGAGHSCGCDSGSEEECGGRRPKRKGRAKPLTAKQMEDALKKALAEAKEGKISSHVSALVEKAKKLEARRKRTTGGAWYDDVANAFNPQSYTTSVDPRDSEVQMQMTPQNEIPQMAAAGRRRKRGGAELYYPPPTTGDRSGLTSDTARRVASGKKRAPSARGAIVSKVMREKGLSLPQASKYVKEHGLY